MLTPEYISSVAEPLVDVYERLENNITIDITRRIVKANYATETAKWQMEKLKEIGALKDDILDALASATGKSKKELRAMFSDAAKQSLKYDDSIYKQAGLTPGPISGSKALNDVLKAGMLEANQMLYNFTNSLPAIASKALGNSLDDAYLKIISGAFSPNEAISDAVDELAKKGFVKIANPSGRVDRVETVVRRAVCTGINQTTARLQMVRMDEMDCDLVEVSSHAGARPSHAIWQGQVYSRSGKVKGYTSFDVCGFGSAEGLCGINCYHSFFPYFEGLSGRSFSKDPSKEYLGKSNDKMYEESQKQRYYERQVRESKRECLTVNSALSAAKGDDVLSAVLRANYESAAAKLKSREAVLARYLDQTGRTRLRDRESVAGWTKSASAKAVSAAKVANQGKVQYNKLIINNDQLGAKIGRHAKDFGLSPSSSEDRAKMLQIIIDIHDAPDVVVHGTWRGQGTVGPKGNRRDGPVDFNIKGNDVVVTKNDVFVTVLKDGVLENTRVKKALKGDEKK